MGFCTTSFPYFVLHCCGCLLESQPCVNMALEHGGIFLKLEFFVFFVYTPTGRKRSVCVYLKKIKNKSLCTISTMQYCTCSFHRNYCKFPTTVSWRAVTVTAIRHFCYDHSAFMNHHTISRSEPSLRLMAVKHFSQGSSSWKWHSAQ